MDALLDTHALLWWLADDDALGGAARRVIEQPRNSILVSAASAWEIATKVRLGKLPGAWELAERFEEQLEMEGFHSVPISTGYALRAGLLPGHHRDPFDRMLAAQAQTLNVPIVSRDEVFDSFGVRRIW